MNAYKLHRPTAILFFLLAHISCFAQQTDTIENGTIELGKKYNAKIRGIFMNTSKGIVEKRKKSRRDPLPLSAIYKQLKQLETPLVGEGFDELIVKKDYEQPRST